MANNNRRHCIPIIYTKGSHYDVGYDVGRNFASIIKSFLDTSECLKDYVKVYETDEGQRVYNETLDAVKQNFPQYIEEIQGTAAGAGVPFSKLFLLHMDDITPKAAGECSIKKPAIGCSTIIVNQPNAEILGHTEDALADVLNHFYFVCADITAAEPRGKWKVKEEKFMSLCYAGHLPGYTMNFNKHGLVFSINTLAANRLNSGKIPRHILTRALLTAQTFQQAEDILLDRGCGAGDGCSINLTFLNDVDRVFWNIEMAPAKVGCNESVLNVKKFGRGDVSKHCNKYLRLPVEEYANCDMIKSSESRMSTFDGYKEPKTKEDVIQMLGDMTKDDYPVFQDITTAGEQVKTIAVGIFDCVKKTWALYEDNPRDRKPLVTIPLQLD